MARILIVDDSGFQRKRMCRVLNRAGYDTQEASDGQKALEAIEECVPDFIVTDLNMPNMTGMELLAKAQERDVDIPIIVLTSDVQDTTREECIERGAAEVMNKPYNEDRLLLAIETYLGPQEDVAP
ncbi:MAG: response regulator [Candidatus Eisenbacteria sp.]|nr:response regulator [Candidatus Eisenbacteria bacterium]